MAQLPRPNSRVADDCTVSSRLLEPARWRHRTPVHPARWVRQMLPTRRNRAPAAKTMVLIPGVIRNPPGALSIRGRLMCKPDTAPLPTPADKCVTVTQSSLRPTALSHSSHAIRILPVRQASGQEWHRPTFHPRPPMGTMLGAVARGHRTHPSQPKVQPLHSSPPVIRNPPAAVKSTTIAPLIPVARNGFRATCHSRHECTQCSHRLPVRTAPSPIADGHGAHSNCLRARCPSPAAESVTVALLITARLGASSGANPYPACHTVSAASTNDSRARHSAQLDQSATFRTAYIRQGFIFVVEYIT